MPYILFYKSKTNIQNNISMNNNIDLNNNINLKNNINMFSNNNNNLNFYNNYNILNQTNDFGNNHEMINQMFEFESNEDENPNSRSKSFAYVNNNEMINHLQEEDEDENMMSVIFGTIDQKLHYSVPCRKTDIFRKIEKKLYKEYPDYKDKNKYFLVNGKQVDVNKTLEENHIKNSDVIILEYYDIQ